MRSIADTPGSVTFTDPHGDAGWAVGRITAPFVLLALTIMSGSGAFVLTAGVAAWCFVVVSTPPPAVRLGDEGLVVRNVLLTHRMEWSAVAGVESRRLHGVRILTRDRDVRCASLRRSDVADLLGRESRSDRVVQEMHRYRRAARAAGGTSSGTGQVVRSSSARPVPSAVALGVVAVAVSAGLVIRAVVLG